MSGAADRPGREDGPALAEQPVRVVLEQLSSREPGPAAGSAAALAAAMGAALTGKTARLSHRQLGGAGVVARAGTTCAVGAGAGADVLAHAADTLRDRALALAGDDAAGVVATLGSAVDGPADPSAVPREIGEVADAVGKLAARLTEHGNPRLRADVVAARHLAAAARTMVDAVVRSNQRTQD